MAETGIIDGSPIECYVVGVQNSDYLVVFDDWDTFYAVFNN